MTPTLPARARSWLRRSRRVRAPVISVIVPTYDCAPFLPRAIDSVLGQGLAEVEILVIDDASTDETQELLRSRYGGDPSLRVLRHERNRGQGVARNTGLEVARGEYVFFLDADDWIDVGAFPELVGLARSSQAEIVACGARLAWADGRVEPFHAFAFECAGGRDALRQFIEYRIGSIVWDKLYQRSFLERHRLRFVDSYGKEDVVFTLETVYACRRYLSTDAVYCNYLQRDDSWIRKIPSTLHLESFVRLYLDVARFVSRHRLDGDPEGREISRGLFWAHCSGDLYPKLAAYVATRPREQWEAECWQVCHDLLGANGYAVADVLIRTMRHTDVGFALRGGAPSPAANARVASSAAALDAPALDPLQQWYVTEALTAAVIENFVQPGMVVLDLGANCGLHTSALDRRVGAQGRVHVFEPNPLHYEALAIYPKTRVWPFAAGDALRTARLHVPRGEHGWASLAVQPWWAADLECDVLDTLEVRIDDLPEIRASGPVAFVKIDVEGHETAALSGMRALLRRDQPLVIVECHDATVGEWLAAEGYQLFELDGSPAAREALGVVNKLAVPPRLRAQVAAILPSEAQVARALAAAKARFFGAFK